MNTKDTNDFFDEAAWLWLHADTWYGAGGMKAHLVKFAVAFAVWFVKHTEGINE